MSLLQALIRFPSLTGQEAGIGAFVANYCQSELKLCVEVIEAAPGRPNVIARWDSGRPGPVLMLNDHLDIVPPGPLEFWSVPPFDAVLSNGRIIGRGAIDTKSGLTTLLAAIAAARAVALPIHGSLVLVLTCDEEVGGALGAQFLGAKGYLTADMALVAEPTSMQIEIATKGRLHLEITSTGIATHAARPWLGHNAIEDMAAIVAGLSEHAVELGRRRHHPLLGAPTICAGTVVGGTVPNMVPNKCVLGIDRRVLPGEDHHQATEEIRAVIARVKGDRGERFNAIVEQRLWWPGYAIEPTEPVVQHLAGAFERVTGRAARIAGKDAGTDASWIHRLGGTPVVMFSPGHGPDAMNADESVSIDDLMTATHVVAEFIAAVLAPLNA